MTGWLVNDALTCIPDTRTFWHDLLDWIPHLEDKTGGYTSFSSLADVIEHCLRSEATPDYIIRNATFFRRLDADVKTISYLQDRYRDERFWHQLEVCNNSVVTVFNSPFVYEAYAGRVESETAVIPIGTDFEHFCKTEVTGDLNLLPESVLYVGSADIATKGFDTVLDLINSTNLNFCLVMKDDYELEHPRVRVFNKVDHSALKDIYNQCAVLVCPSRMETLHLAGIEAGACGTPIVATDVGVYNGLRGDPRWGHVAPRSSFKAGVQSVLENRDAYNPRSAFLEAGLDKETCRKKWCTLIEEVTR